ncbi:MAG: peptide-binding protein [Magnetococcales bacterium]|nr:peptide-binding protein [Magnetococcales bacterium]|tara:strand:+ start:4875 stop:6509 length:1635 start_codon:yes stop_codon:yes gene_type:complete
MLLNKVQLFSALLFLSACSSSDEAQTEKDVETSYQKARGGVYLTAAIGEASNLIPWTSSDSASHAVSGHIYNGLLKYDKDLNLTGDLAESWNVSDDGLTMTFHLKKGVKWSDGSELTAHDVMATFKTITDPETLSPYSGDYKMVQSGKVVDDYTFEASYNKPFAPALSSWTLKILPQKRLEAENINDSSLKSDPLGTGPYTLTNWKRGEFVHLTARSDYFEHEPYISQLLTRQIPDMDTQFLELKAGNLDSMGLKPLQFTRLTDTARFKKTFNKYKYLSNGYTYMGFNLNNNLFSDKQVRQALSYAVNRQEIVDGVLYGQGLPLACPFKPGTWAYNNTIAPYPYDIQKSKQLLKNAGWVDSDGNGILDKDGQEFEFTVVTNQGNDLRKMTAELMQQAFKEVGVKMNINVQEWSTFIENTINKRQFDAFILGWSLSPEPDPYDIFHSSKTGEKEFNIVGFNNEEADKMMDKARGTFDQVERKKYLDRFQEILHDEQPYLFLYAPYSLIAVHKRIQNIEEAPAGISHNFIDWYIPQELQTRNVMQQ